MFRWDFNLLSKNYFYDYLPSQSGGILIQNLSVVTVGSKGACPGKVIPIMHQSFWHHQLTRVVVTSGTDRKLSIIYFIRISFTFKVCGDLMIAVLNIFYVYIHVLHCYMRN